MACDALIWGLLFVGCSVQILWAISEDDPLEYMSKEEKEALKFVSSTIRLNLYQSFFVIALSYFIGKKRGICSITHTTPIW